MDGDVGRRMVVITAPAVYLKKPETLFSHFTKLQSNQQTRNEFKDETSSSTCTNRHDFHRRCQCKWIICLFTATSQCILSPFVAISILTVMTNIPIFAISLLANSRRG